MFNTDFIGFTIDNIHSSELNLIRVSDGSRYSEDLLPPISNQEIEIPGGDGSYLMGSNFKARKFPISVAFDSVSEQNFRKIRQLFGSRKLLKLTFDETPYKYYNVKLESPPQFKYICFEEDGERIYKGEGNLDFIAFDPFGYNTKKCLADFSDVNISEWGVASGLLETNRSLNPPYITNYYDTYSNSQFNLYNAGDLPTYYTLKIPFTGTTISPFLIEILGSLEDRLEFSQITRVSPNDHSILINSKLNLIEGINSSNKLTGSVYNNFIKEGHFFKIPLGESILKITAQPAIATAAISYPYIYY